MLLKIGLFLMQTIVHFLVIAFLLRSYALFFRININSSANAIGDLIFALTDWLVLPLRRILPRTGRLDLASVLSALFFLLAFNALKSLMIWDRFQWSFFMQSFFFELLSLIISFLTGLLILQAVLSWLQSYSPAQHLISQLCEPVLKPIRRFMPLVGNVDLSPLVALLILQVIGMVINA